MLIIVLKYAIVWKNMVFLLFLPSVCVNVYTISFKKPNITSKVYINM